MSQPESHLHEVPFAALEEFEDAGPLVGILIGSESDREGIEPAVEELNERGISNELRVLSAHRDPRGVAEYASNAALRGVRVIIAGAGMSAALPGAVAAYTELPVIGVPMTSSKTAAGGLDAILSIVQMPPGVPVACVSLNGARNAAILAAKILAQGGGYPIGPGGTGDRGLERGRGPRGPRQVETCRRAASRRLRRRGRSCRRRRPTARAGVATVAGVVVALVVARTGTGVGRRAGVVSVLVLALVVVAGSCTRAARVVGVLGLVAGTADVLALVVVIGDGVILGVVAAPAAIVVCILALLVRVVVLGHLGAGALGIVRVLGLVAGALDVHDRGGRIGARAAVRARCDGDADSNGQHRGENEEKLVDGIHCHDLRGICLLPDRREAAVQARAGFR